MEPLAVYCPLSKYFCHLPVSAADFPLDIIAEAKNKLFQHKFLLYERQDAPANGGYNFLEAFASERTLKQLMSQGKSKEAWISLETNKQESDS